ncbi:heteromeric transposase endonuclease subunit TnsA [Thiomicrospira pelophila]|uniref:heteromeric transposase endonuclease subunit TnsA n=1 Tax=Thiomicrospira pelophila TaxID=934 RepID=UPI0004A6A9C0|nr:heteromeric transposase endonuclease subunit TnsA [Thiomicrospira pelophila]
MHNIQPVRKHLTVYGSISGNYPFRNEKIIWFESQLEKHFLRKLEFNDAVLDVVTQPVEIPYTTEKGNKSTYTPDMLIIFSSRGFYHPESTPKPILAEIKPHKKLKENWPDLRTKFKAGLAYAKEQGWLFHIYDEKRIHDQYLENLNYLKRFNKGQYNQDILDQLVDTLEKIGHCKVNELAAYLFKSETNLLIGIQHTWNLIAKKKISCEMNQPLSNNTVIWVNNPEATYYGGI